MKKIVAFIVLVLSAGLVSANDFQKELLLYWSFNSLETAPAFFHDYMRPRGYAGGSLELGGNQFHVSLQDQVVLKKRFSINFWFKPQDHKAKQTILKVLGDKDLAVEFSLDKRSIACNVNGHKVEHYPFMILNNDWALVSLTYDGQMFHLTLFSNLVTSTTHFAVSNFVTQSVKEIHIATGSAGFRGFLDEVMIYGIDILPEQLEQMYRGKLPEENKVATKPIVNNASTVVENPNQLIASEPKVKRILAGETIVDQKMLILELVGWSKRKVRPDVKLNDAMLMRGVTDVAGVTMLKLDTDQSNALCFVTPMDADVQDVTMRLMHGVKELQSFTLPIMPGTETVFNITYRSPDLAITEVQKTLIASQRQLVIEVWDDKIADGDFISIYLDDNKLVDYQEISKAKITVAVTLQPEKPNLITFVSEDTGRYGNNSARVRILEFGKQVDEFLFTSTYRKRAGLLIRLQEKK